jgi:hypothetical protein
MLSPYQNLPPNRFWRTGVSETTPATVTDLYRKKFAIAPGDRIATAGSCFAQHIARYMRSKNFSVLDVEPPPPLLPDDQREKYGYGLYSARYGNIYTARQLLQLAHDAFDGQVSPANVWVKDGRYYDALRPNIEPNGFASAEEALANRRSHLEKVRLLLETVDIFVFTFGLTETWVGVSTGRAYPTAPGTIAGEFDPRQFEFRNFGFNEVYEDFVAFRALVLEHNPSVRFLVTVSPVPLTATASEHHVLVATTYSKSVLRAVAGALAAEFADVDYVPSYEIIAAPWSKGALYESNLRSVTPEGVATVMRMFFAEHGEGTAAPAVQKDRADERKERRKQRRARRMKGRQAARRGDAENGEPKALSEAVGARAARARKRRGRSQKEVCEEILLEAFAQPAQNRGTT